MGAFDFLLKKKKAVEGNDLEAVLTPEKKQNFLQSFLPEDEDKRRAVARSLIMGGASAMAAGGPSKDPMNFMSVLGQGLAGGIGGYDKSIEADLESNKLAATNKINNVKLQTLQDSQNRANSFIQKYGKPSANGYSIEALFELHQMQLANGDEESARATQKMIQELQQTAAGNGMVLGEDGYELAPGYGESLRMTETNKSLGNAVGQNAQLTADQKDFRFGQSDPAFREYELQQKKAGVAGSDKFGEKGDQLAAERFQQLAEQGQQSREMVGNLDVLTNLSRSIGTGKWSEVKRTFGPYFQAVGVDLGNMDEIQAFDSLVAKTAPTLRVPGSGATSDFDASQFLKALPSLANTPGGNELIAETTKAVENNKIAAANIANRVNNREITWQDGDRLIAELPDSFAAFKKFRGVSDGGEGSGKTSRSVTVVSSEEQFNALPKGTPFRFDDEEEVRVKQ